MNRRSFLAMTLGALAAPLAHARGERLTHAEKVVSNADLFVSSSAEVSAAIDGLKLVDDTVFTSPVPLPEPQSLVSVGSLIISTQEQADAFLDLVAEAVLSSARRAH